MSPVINKLFDGTRVTFSHLLYGDEYQFHRCGHCGIVWGMPDWFLVERQKDGRDWNCPNGHTFVYNGGRNEADMLREQLKATKDKLARTTARADQTQASLRATKGVVTKQRKRLEKVVAGVCPVDGCKRHFRDLRRHIATKHPDYHGQS